MSDTLRAGAWVRRAAAASGTRVRLFCLPCAGSGTLLYRAWERAAPSSIECCPVQLPGREDRLFEPAYDRLAPLVAALARALRPHLDGPYALLGHSMGALVAFETVRALRDADAPPPRRLFVSAFRAPHLPDPTPPVHALPGASFWDELRRLNGTPREVLDNDEMRRLVEPTLRADFAVHETYVHAGGEPVACPITAFGGLDDPDVTRDMLEAWRRHTRAGFRLRLFPGDHFFIHAARHGLLAAIAEDSAAGSPVIP